jgi:hypothetical protein
MRHIKSKFVLQVLGLSLVVAFGIPAKSLLAGTPYYWSALAWSPDGTRLATVGWEVALYSDDAELINTTNLCPETTRSMCTNRFFVNWSPNGRALAVYTYADFPVSGSINSSYTDTGIEIWDSENLSTTRNITAQINNLGSSEAIFLPIVWNADSTQFFAPTANNEQYFIDGWDVEATGRVTHLPINSYAASYTLIANLSATHFAYQDNRIVHILNASDGLEVCSTANTFEESIYLIRWEDDTTLSIMLANERIFFDLNTCQVLETQPFGILADTYRHILSPDGQWIASFYSSDLLIWDAHTGTTVYSVPTTDGIGYAAIAWHPDSTLLAAVTYQSESIQLIDLNELRPTTLEATPTP